MKEPLPLATIHATVLEFLRGREDAAIFGAQAVNAYVSEPRMTQDVDIVSPRARGLAAELRQHLARELHVAIRVREVAQGNSFRLFQVRKEGNRHLVDIRAVDALPSTERYGDLLIVTPVELIAGKVLCYHHRRGSPKSGTDWRDLAMLLLAFPALKSFEGPVKVRLQQSEVDPAVLDLWRELASQQIRAPDEDEY